MGLLLGDVDGDGTVTSADFSIEKADQGQTTDDNNFRADIDASGSIDRRMRGLSSGRLELHCRDQAFGRLGRLSKVDMPALGGALLGSAVAPR